MALQLDLLGGQEDTVELTRVQTGAEVSGFSSTREKSKADDTPTKGFEVGNADT